MDINDDIKESFNHEFCAFLERHLCDTFRNSELKETRKLWCDGIIWNYFSKKLVNDRREINTVAWIGNNGQDKYEIKIKFGKYSLRRYAKGTRMIDCIPNSNSTDWIEIDLENRNIEIELK